MSEEAAAVPSTSSSHPSSSSSNPPPPPQTMENPSLHNSDPQVEQIINRGQGLYAVQYDFSLIPLTYKIPIRRANAAGEEQGQGGGGEAIRQQAGVGQRQVVVRRFQFAFQLDLALLLKLAFAVVLFSQEGSRQRTILLILSATLVYLYQTGVLTPLIRYARRGLTPPQPFAARPQNAVVRQNEANDQQQPDNAVAGGAENENQPAAEGNQQEAEAERANNGGINVIGIAREIRTFVVGFIASLLPGFEHPHND